MTDYATAHCVSLRNHGDSFHAPTMSYDEMAQDVLDYCSEHGVEKFKILGHSLGGRVAMTVC